MRLQQNSIKGIIGMLRDRGGNFAMTTALLLPLIMGGAGVAMDTIRLVSAKRHLQDATDSAALAAASGLANEKMTVDQAKRVARDHLKLAIQNWLRNSSKLSVDTPEEEFAKNADVSVTQSSMPGNGKRYMIQVSADLSVDVNAFSKLLGITEKLVSASSESRGTTATESALSIYLVLDRSGSMAWKTAEVNSSKASCSTYQESNWPKATWSTPCYWGKIEVLKTAVGSLISQLNKADPGLKFVRTGGVSYSTKTDSPSNMAWGTSALQTYVTALKADGGTDSSDGMKLAYDTLKQNTEDNAHLIKNGLVPKKAIVLMTDGENNFSEGVEDKGGVKSDAKTRTACSDARAAGMTVYSVAFMAPDRGQKLLKECAGDPSRYFQAEDNKSLIAAFEKIGRDAAELGVELTQ